MISEIVDLTTLKLFGLRSRGLAYKVDVATIHIVEVRRRIKAPRLPPEIVDFSFAVKISPRFLVSPTDLQSRQQPTFTDSLALFTFFRGFWMTTWHDLETRTILQVDPHSLTLTGACFSILGTLSMGKLTLNRPSLQSLICNLPDFGRHLTSPSQGLPSLTSWGVKRRDPGNEVGPRPLTAR